MRDVRDMMHEAVRDSASSMQQDFPFRKNPFVRLVNLISRPSSFRVDLPLEERTQVRMAMVSLPELPLDDPKCVKIERHYIVDDRDLKHLDSDSCIRSLVGFTPQFSKTLEEWYIEALKYSVEDLEADIVCLNELGFPSFRQKPLSRALHRTRKIAEKNQCFIIAGSSHDRRTYYNSGHIFFPGCPPKGERFHKQVSALAVGERISLLPERKARCTRVFGLNIAMLICLDVADYASVAAVVRAADQIDVLLVPCYSEWIEPLERIAHCASKAMSGIVALVNYRRPGQSGCVVTQFGETIELERPKELASGAVVHLHSIDVPGFRSQKTQLQMSMSPEDRMEWLFGEQNQPVRPR